MKKKEKKLRKNLLRYLRDLKKMIKSVPPKYWNKGF